MTRLSSRLDAVPHWARWVMFLPTGVMAALIVDAVFNAVFDALGLPRSPQNPEAVMRLALSAFAWALTLTFVPAVLSPRPWAVGVVMFIAGLLLRIAPILSMMTVPYQRARLPSLAVMFVATTAAQVLGGGVALYFIRGMTSGTNDGKAAMNVNRTIGGAQ